MSSRAPVYILLLLVAAVLVFYFSFNQSYQKSLQARVYYFLGDYKDAYSLSQEAYALDPYNRMAFTVLTQSKISFKYEKYIEDGKEYLKKIEEISSKKEPVQSDMVRVKMMCEIMMERYRYLSPTVLTDKDLAKDALRTYEKFEKIHEELF